LKELKTLFSKPCRRGLESLQVGPDLGFCARLAGIGVHTRTDREQVGDQLCCREQAHRIGGDHSRIADPLFDEVVDGGRVRGLGSHQRPTF
jgi:hypothetical protein